MTNLNSDQQKALKFIRSWWFSGEQEMILDGPAGTGKAQPLDEPVLTPTGFKPMEQIKVGDYVISEKGLPIKVIAEHFHEKVKMYELTFSDGSSTRCCEDHLWRIQTKSDRLNNSYSVLPTKMLLDYKKSNKHYSGRSITEYKYSIPMCSPVTINSVDARIDPYFLGYILGNGSSIPSGLNVSCHIQDWKEIESFFGESNIVSSKAVAKNCGLIRLSKEVRKAYDSYGLAGIKTLEKYIPAEVFLWSVDNRKMVLAGLLDSDGSCETNKIRFSTSSHKLAKDVQNLVWSLGGLCSLGSHTRKGKNTEYQLKIRLPFNPFRLKRKANKYTVSTRYSMNRRTITHIKEIGYLAGKCITVDNLTALYITKDYTVTHNSYLVNQVLTAIPNVKPIILSPTHEALKQLRDKVEGDYLFKTVHSALGIAPIDEGKELDFEHIAYPALWDKVNLAIVDECSMVPEQIVKLLHGTKTKILWCGHAAQLPPVNKNRKIFDKCISPVFKLKIPIVTLTIPQRNTGDLWDFCNKLAGDVYAEGNHPISTEYDITRSTLLSYVTGDGKEEIFSGKTKFILWSNAGVDGYNRRFRVKYFGQIAKEYPYLPGDKILLTKPLAAIEYLEKHTETSLKKLVKNKDIETYYTNTKAEVIHAENRIVKLNTNLHIPVWKITCKVEDSVVHFYEPVFHQDHERIAIYYEHVAWGFKDAAKKKKAYAERNFIRSCFAEIKHSYAMSAHRAQGSSIENVILILSDIMKNNCSVERKKCIYVAASRAIKNLMIYRGL